MSLLDVGYSILFVNLTVMLIPTWLFSACTSSLLVAISFKVIIFFGNNQFQQCLYMKCTRSEEWIFPKISPMLVYFIHKIFISLYLISFRTFLFVLSFIWPFASYTFLVILLSYFSSLNIYALKHPNFLFSIWVCEYIHSKVPIILDRQTNTL